MHGAPSDLEIEFHTLTPEQEEEVCRVWVDVFCKREPVMRMLEVREDDFLVYARTRIEAARPHQLSFIVKDKRHGELLGFRLLTDISSPPVALPSGSKLEFLFDCFHELEKKWTAEPFDFPEGQWAYSIGVAVRRPFIQRGIARQIYRESEKILSERGFRGLIMHCTNAYTTDICRQLGYREVASLPYANAQDGAGHLPFKDVPPPHLAMTLFEGRLTKP